MNLWESIEQTLADYLSAVSCDVETMTQEPSGLIAIKGTYTNRVPPHRPVRFELKVSASDLEVSA